MNYYEDDSSSMENATADSTFRREQAQSEKAAGKAYEELVAAMAGAGFDTSGVYRDVRQGRDAASVHHVLSMGEMTIGTTRRLAEILHTARRS
ncbi:hypothetical protein [Streptomyces jumonjinensis]|uniref:hypothetical protein n=1 Tax=Streptomyces jumonjinensis TaxID=1945 RepID=UPI00379CF6A6